MGSVGIPRRAADGRRRRAAPGPAPGSRPPVCLRLPDVRQEAPGTRAKRSTVLAETVRVNRTYGSSVRDRSKRPQSRRDTECFGSLCDSVSLWPCMAGMATELRKREVVVVGLGAAGGIAVLPLARAGLDVVGLEAGTWLNADDFAPDELSNNVRGWPQAVQKANREVPTQRPTASSPYSPRLPVHPMMNGVGGTSLHYWGQSWRLSPWDFRVVSETRRRYGASRIPKGSTVEDWPFGLDELEPYYDQVEYEVGVSGNAGNVNGKIDRRGNIFEGPRRRDYPMPALRGTAFLERMADAGRKLGWHPFPGPAAINSRPYQNR